MRAKVLQVAEFPEVASLILDLHFSMGLLKYLASSGQWLKLDEKLSFLLHEFF